MAKVIAIVGYGPGVSNAVADQFGEAGFAVALIARSGERTKAGVSALKAKGVTAAAYQANAGDAAEIRAVMRKVHDDLGPITAILWNAFGGREAGDILVTDPKVVAGVYDVAIVGLLSAVQEALPDLKAAGDGAVLITNGAMSDLNPAIDQWAVGYGATGVALANGAKAKLVGLLSARLKSEGVFVGEVTIAGAIKGTPTGDAESIEAAEVAGKFWDMYRTRSEMRMRVTDPRRG
ncbi:MAG: SDR family NAD(P)-dependent oxidoreductase [Devosia sp.]|nr:SDR family NAD(P)-dependent oxidoreductase [Devosia sp.]